MLRFQVAQQNIDLMQHTKLDLGRLAKARAHDLRKAFQAFGEGDENIFTSTRLQLAHSGKPEVSIFCFCEPQAQSIHNSFAINGQASVSNLRYHLTVLLNFGVNQVYEKDAIDFILWTNLSFFTLSKTLSVVFKIRVARYRCRRILGLYIAHTHLKRLHATDFHLETNRLIILVYFGFKSALTILRNIG